MVKSGDELAKLVSNGSQQLFVIDTRSFLQYNDSHVRGALNFCGSKLLKRRLERNDVMVTDILRIDRQQSCVYVVYEESGTQNCFFNAVLQNMRKNLSNVHALQGGFSEFSFKYPKLCDSRKKKTSLLSLSTPCTSATSCPPTRVLPFLYLGCEEDAQNGDLLQQCRIKYVLNASVNAADSPHCKACHYTRIPIQDSNTENIADWFPLAFEFIDKVRESDSNLLLHCVGGVSRSAAIAIAYVMRHLSLSLENAYRYVKEKRPTISPNLNFMGQLLQFEENLRQQTELVYSPFPPDLNLDGLNIHTVEQFAGFPSPGSDLVPSPESDVVPSPISETSQSENELSDSCEVTSRRPPLSLGVKPRDFTLDLTTSS